MGVIDYRDARPIYEQVADHYRKLILKGVMEEGEQMPSVRSLAMELSTNPNTIQKAYSELIRDGYIYTVKGLGNFVADNKELIREHEKELLSRLEDIRDECTALGLSMDGLLKKLSSKENDNK